MYWILLTLLAVVVYWFLSLKADYWKRRGFPYLKGHLLFGNFMGPLLFTKTVGEQIQENYKKLKGHRYAGVLDSLKPVVMIMDPELVNTVLVKDFSSFYDRDLGLPNPEVISPILYSIFTMTGSTWRSLRYKLAPTFTSGKLKIMLEQMGECSDEIVSHLGEENSEFEARELMNKFTINTIGSIAYGLKISSHKEDESKSAFVELTTRFFRPSIPLILKLIFTGVFPKVTELLKLRLIDDDVAKFFIALVRDTIKQREEAGIRRNDFLQMMLDIRGKNIDSNLTLDSADRELLDQSNTSTKSDTNVHYEFTDVMIAAHTFIFISAGSDTLAQLLSFGLFEIARHPEVQRRVQEEIDTAINEKGFTYDSITSLRYLEQVVNEVVRIHSPFKNMDRICTQDFLIPNSNHIIRKGESVRIPNIGLQNDPEYWVDPETFNPDRFENPDSIIKGTFLPFGGGPRFCIAMRLSYLLAKLFLAKFFLKFNLRVSAKTQLPLKKDPKSFSDFVLGGVWLKHSPR